jgi:hypothetical protein
MYSMVNFFHILFTYPPINTLITYADKKELLYTTVVSFLPICLHWLRMAGPCGEKVPGQVISCMYGLAQKPVLDQAVPHV